MDRRWRRGSSISPRRSWALADRLLAAADHLLRGPVVNRALMEEIRPWLVAFELGAQAIRRLADLVADGRLEEDGPAELRPILIKLRRARVRVFGDSVEMTLSHLTGTMFRPGEVPEVEGTTRPVHTDAGPP